MPTRDDFLCIVIVQALTPNFPDHHLAVVCELAASTPIHPCTSTQLVKILELDTKFMANISSSFALATQHSCAPVKEVCTVCHRSTHSAPYCIHPGGGMASQTIQAARTKHLTDQGKSPVPPKSSSAPAIVPTSTMTTNTSTLKDKSGRAFIVDAVSGQAFLLTGDALLTIPETADISQTFVGLATNSVHDIISPGIASSMCPADYEELIAFIDIDKLKASVDWCATSVRADSHVTCSWVIGKLSHVRTIT
ncbi:hypothetical protein IW262DRAFT_1456836 [Armillaria fumosa]|nr:hypothetical protein IW262DRAFT_1456836 [Armillaria fumosa]